MDRPGGRIVKGGGKSRGGKERGAKQSPEPRFNAPCLALLGQLHPKCDLGFAECIAELVHRPFNLGILPGRAGSGPQGCCLQLLKLCLDIVDELVLMPHVGVELARLARCLARPCQSL